VPVVIDLVFAIDVFMTLVIYPQGVVLPGLSRDIAVENEFPVFVQGVAAAAVVEVALAALLFCSSIVALIEASWRAPAVILSLQGGRNDRRTVLSPTIEPLWNWVWAICVGIPGQAYDDVDAGALLEVGKRMLRLVVVVACWSVLQPP
jgi:hypothetical protein